MPSHTFTHACTHDLHPQADILSMVNNRLSLLVDDDYLSGQFTDIATQLGKLLPGMDVGAFVCEVLVWGLHMLQ